MEATNTTAPVTTTLRYTSPEAVQLAMAGWVSPYWLAKVAHTVDDTEYDAQYIAANGKRTPWASQAFQFATEAEALEAANYWVAITASH